MTDDELSPIVQHGYDLGTLDEVLGRLCQTDAERAALKRVLGLEQQDRAAADAFTPERPPAPETSEQCDHLARTREAVARYEARVASYPDDDPTPLLERERVLDLARRNLRRLEGGS